MTNYKPAPDDLGHVADEALVPRHEFTEANGLHSWAFDEDTTVQLSCPDCPDFCMAENLGELVDWVLGHKCDDGTAALAAREGE